MRDKKYLSGVITGVLATLTILIVVGIIAVITMGNDLLSNGDSSSSHITKSVEDSEEAIFSKLTALTSLLDKESLYDIDEENAIEGIYKGVFENIGDKYAAYYTKEEFESFKESTNGEYGGIGAYVSEDKSKGTVFITGVMENTPAEDAGLKENDIVCEVDGKNVEGENSDTVVSLMKGKENTVVKVGVLREGEKVDLEITRKKIEVPTVTYTLKDDKIAYITISAFDSVTTEQFSKCVANAKKDDAEGVIIDLRDNPGGNLDVVVDMLDMFLDKDELIVYTENKEGERTDERKAEKEKEIDLPLVVLVNGNSASASEIFSANIQDHKLGTLVGEKTFGKGIVQVLRQLSDGSAIKFTTDKYFTPEGRDIHEKGIEPDVKVELDKEKYISSSGKEDNQYDEAVKELKKIMK